MISRQKSSVFIVLREMEEQERHFERGRMGTFCVGLERCGVVVRVDCTFRPAAFLGVQGCILRGAADERGICCILSCVRGDACVVLCAADSVT